MDPAPDETVRRYLEANGCLEVVGAAPALPRPAPVGVPRAIRRLAERGYRPMACSLEATGKERRQRRAEKAARHRGNPGAIAAVTAAAK
jgi:hypothetical protein